MEEYQIGQKNEEHLEAFARHVIIQEAFLWKKKNNNNNHKLAFGPAFQLFKKKKYFMTSDRIA